MLKILPQQFYQNPEVKKILVDGLSCVIHKELAGPVFHKEGYVSTHAITLVLNGTMRIENDGGFLTHVSETQMVFLPKDLYMISDIIPDQGSFEAVVFFFDEQLIADFINSINLKTAKEKCVTHITLDYSKEIRIFTESLLQVYNKKELTHRNLTRIKLFELLHLISSHQQGNCFLTALATLNNKERRSLREFMNANFSKPLTIEDYAYLTGRSLSSFRRDFIEQFGVSPKQWLIEKRLEKAQELLSLNHTNVSTVALETGYENTSHFVKAFHKRYGISPKQFLMKKRKEVLV
ncbi:MAG TPA: AraC family transcriptional regulator [Cyclobacteriaceae bacterium]|nr:AraC family transcriptional regulator [Cyclobacteriaceae bacterium]